MTISPAYRNLIDRMKATNGLPSPFAQSGYKDVNNRDDDGLDQDADGAAREAAQFIKDAFRAATGQPPIEDDDDGVEQAVGKADAKPVRTILAAIRRTR